MTSLYSASRSPVHKRTPSLSRARCSNTVFYIHHVPGSAQRKQTSLTRHTTRAQARTRTLPTNVTPAKVPSLSIAFPVLDPATASPWPRGDGWSASSQKWIRSIGESLLTTCACVCIHTDTYYTYTCIICMNVRIYLYLYMHIHVYVHIYIYIYVHIYIYTHTY